MTATTLSRPAAQTVDLSDLRARVRTMDSRGGRNRYFDVLRAGCIGYVVLYHAFPLAAFSYWPRMGLLFAIAGSLTARSLDAAPRRAVLTRLRRLLVPLWVAAAVTVPLMLTTGWRPEPRWELLLWVVPFGDPPGAAWAGPLTDVLWYLRTYLWLLLLSPVLLPVFRRFPRTTVAVPVSVAVSIGIGLLPVVTLGDQLGPLVRDASVYLPCWLLGFAHRDEWLAHARRRTVLAGGGLLALAGIAWALTHPVAGSIDLNEIPLAQLLFSTGTVLLLLRATPSCAGLERRWWPYQPVNWLVMLVNRRAMVVYLWHNPAIALSFPVASVLGVWSLGTVAGTICCGLIGLTLIVTGAVVLGWIEDLSAGRRPTLIPKLPPLPVFQPLAALPAGSEQPEQALRLFRPDQFPADQCRPIRVVHAVGIAGDEIRVTPTTLLIRELAWSPYPGRTETAPESPRRPHVSLMESCR